MSELTDQLRRIYHNVHRGNILTLKEIQDATWKAADEIERLTAELAEANEQLQMVQTGSEYELGRHHADAFVTQLMAERDEARGWAEEYRDSSEGRTTFPWEDES